MGDIENDISTLYESISSDYDDTSAMTQDNGVEDKEVELIKKRMKEIEVREEMEEETEKESQTQMNHSSPTAAAATALFPSQEEMVKADARSEYKVITELEAKDATKREIEAELEKLKKMKNEVEQQINLSSPTAAATAAPFPSLEEKVEADARSVFVGNVDYGATAEELERHFHGCGPVNRVTILCDPFSNPKGYAFMEFGDRDSVVNAMTLDGSFFRGRNIKVNPKRTNKPGFAGVYRGGFPPRVRQSFRRFQNGAYYYSPY